MSFEQRVLRQAGSLPFPDKPEGTANGQMPFDHVVVVMMENHSFDNLLGALTLTNPAVDGLTFVDGKAINSNPGADGMEAAVSVFPFPDTAQGSDVSQTWRDAHEQINQGAMDGFVRSTEATQSMGYYTRETLPFAYSLASRFTVANRWFCSLPGPTYPNRRFLLAGTASGCTVTNSDTLLELSPPNGTIFDLLSQHGISWCNYFSDVPMTMVIPTTIIDHPAHHLPIREFFDHCRAGTLPSVSFVDPRIGVLSRIGEPIASLPPFFRELLSRIGADLSSADSAQTEEDPQDMYNGEMWAHSVIQAVLDSPTWSRTLLIYTYDEHGGYYDHVPPPAAIEPDEIPPKLEPDDPAGAYNLYGPRVPAIVVSPYSRPGAVTDVVHDHTSVLATIEAKWNLPALTRRDANAHTVMDFLDLAQAPLLHPPQLQAPSATGPSGPVASAARTANPTATLESATITSGSPLKMTTSLPASKGVTDSQQLTMTFRIAVVGIAAVLLAFLVAVIFLNGSKNPGQTIPAVLGGVVAAIGTLAGLVAGHAAGAAGKAASDQRANDNERDATAGRALARSMLVDVPSPVVAQPHTVARPSGPPSAQPAPTEVARRHAELARSLFPDVANR
jgi:phospholipase C